MASNDTAALVVALSAQLTKFEKDMKGAVDIADRRTKEIETTFTRLNSTISGKLSEVSASMVGNLGFAGTLLTKLGPIGIAAAAGIGATVGAWMALTEATAQFAEKSKALKEASETAGLTITQFKLLGSAGRNVGLGFDETTAFFTKYIVNLEELRKGGGPLYDALLKIDVGLLRQLSATKDSAQAIDILVAAYGRLTDQTARLALARAAGGRAGLSGGRLLESLSDKGGLSGLEASSPGIDEEQIKRAAQLKIEIEGIEKKTKNIWGGMFSDAILEEQKHSAEIWLSIAQAVERVARGTETIGNSNIDFGEIASGIKTPAIPSAEATAEFKARFGEWETIANEASKKIADYLDGAANKKPPPVSAAVELALLQKNTALLGEAITQGEQWRQKKLEIAAAVEKGGVADGVASRALQAFNVVQRAAALTTRERLGIANEQQILDVKLAQLQQDKVKFGLSTNEVQAATVVILRETKVAAEALEVRRAYLPGLKQLQLDSQNLAKGLDGLLTSGLNTVTDDLAAFATGTKTAKEAFTSMVQSILSDLIKLSIRQSITGPLAGMLGGLFGGGGSLPGTAGSAFFGPTAPIGRNAEGTDNWRGGPTWVGEKGPEIVNLPRGAQVVPNAVAARGGGGSVFSPVYQINAAGADSGTVARIQSVLAVHARAIAGQSRAMQSAQRMQATGVG